MAFQMLIITKNIKEGRRVPLLDAWLLAGRGHCSAGSCVEDVLPVSPLLSLLIRYHAEKETPAPSSVSSTFCSLYFTVLYKLCCHKPTAESLVTHEGVRYLPLSNHFFLSPHLFLLSSSSYLPAPP